MQARYEYHTIEVSSVNTIACTNQPFVHDIAVHQLTIQSMSYCRLYFPAYAAAKRWLSSGETSSKPQAHHLLIAGAMAGIPAASLTTPADVIKVILL
jgi:hypothetical protein